VGRAPDRTGLWSGCGDAAITRQEIYVHLTEKIKAEWGAYRQAMLQLLSVSVFAKADEIHAD